MIDRLNIKLINGIIATTTERSIRNGVVTYHRLLVISDEEGEAVTIDLQSRDLIGLYIEDRDKEG